jgi:hypothetical protein
LPKHSIRSAGAGFSIQTIAPTAIDPLVALSENKDWTGKPIAKEDFNKLSPTPGFSRSKDTASDPSKWIAEAINTISRGNKYVPGMASPTADQIDYLFNGIVFCDSRWYPIRLLFQGAL